MPVLKNVSLRIVGVYLRINDPFNTAVDPPKGPVQIDLPEIDVPALSPKVVDVMDAVAGLIKPQEKIASLTVSSPSLRLRFRGRCLSLSGTGGLRDQVAR